MKYIFICVLTILLLPSYSQDSTKMSVSKLKKLHSEKQIIKLKNGVLLVRLKTSKTTIAALIKGGMPEKALEVEEAVKKENKEILKAFRSNFTFCKVYFFSSDYSKNVRLQNFDSVFFYNDDLEIDKTIRPEITNFLIGEFCEIEADTVSFYSGKKLVQGETGLEEGETYYGSESLGFEALIIRSEEFVQLVKPFPFYSRTWDGWIKPYKVVHKMNNNLLLYYKKVN